MKTVFGFMAGLAVGVFFCAAFAQQFAPAAAEQAAAECVTAAQGPVGVAAAETPPQAPAATPVRPVPRVAGVGRLAPDFEASAFVDGGFKNLKLSDFRGKWVVLCFYPGDFTFV